MMSSTIVATMDMTVKLGITLPKSIIQKIDQKRGDIARSRYIRRAIEDTLLVVKIKTTTAPMTTTKRQQQSKKVGGNRKMSGIESSIMPFVSTIGFGGIAGFLLGFALKRIMKILAVIAGVFFAALMYLESQHIVNINWDKLQTISNGIVSTITTTTNATSTSGGGVGPIQSILGNNSTVTAAATAILPITSTMANLGIPLTGSTAIGLTLGFLKG